MWIYLSLLNCMPINDKNAKVHGMYFYHNLKKNFKKTFNWTVKWMIIISWLEWGTILGNLKPKEYFGERDRDERMQNSHRAATSSEWVMLHWVKQWGWKYRFEPMEDICLHNNTFQLEMAWAPSFPFNLPQFTWCV